MTLATLFTLTRVLLIPFICWANFRKLYALSLILFVIAALTDLFDGRIARALNQVTPLGALLDPVADKAVDLTFTWLFWHEGTLPGWFTVLLFTRNIAQLLSIPILLWIMKIPFQVKPHFLAKLATAVAFIILTFCFTSQWSGWSEQPEFRRALGLLIALSSLLELYVLANYLPRFRAIALRRHDTFE